MKETKNVTQQSVVNGYRRWFSDDSMDLIVWYTPEHDIIGFQLCYDREVNEHVLTWKANGGYTHNRVDDGEANPSTNMSPVLVPDGNCPATRLIDSFTHRAGRVDTELRGFILDKLKHVPTELV